MFNLPNVFYQMNILQYYAKTKAFHLFCSIGKKFVLNLFYHFSHRGLSIWAAICPFIQRFVLIGKRFFLLERDLLFSIYIYLTISLIAMITIEICLIEQRFFPLRSRLSNWAEICPSRQFYNQYQLDQSLSNWMEICIMDKFDHILPNLIFTIMEILRQNCIYVCNIYCFFHPHSTRLMLPTAIEGF